MADQTIKINLSQAGPKGPQGNQGPQGPPGAGGVIKQATPPTGLDDGAMWYNTTNDLTYILKAGVWVRFVDEQMIADSNGDLNLNGGYF